MLQRPWRCLLRSKTIHHSFFLSPRMNLELFGSQGACFSELFCRGQSTVKCRIRRASEEPFSWYSIHWNSLIHTWGSLVYRVTGLKYTKVWVMWWMRQTSCQWKGDVQYVKAEKPDDNILYFFCRQSFENINTFDSGKRWHEVIWGSTCCPYAACSTRSFSSLLKPSCQIKPRPKKKAFWLVTGHG